MDLWLLRYDPFSVRGRGYEISASVFEKSQIDQMGPSQEHVSDNLESIGGVQ